MENSFKLNIHVIDLYQKYLYTMFRHLKIKNDHEAIISDSHLPKNVGYWNVLHWKTFKIDENAFYFILKALLILNKFKFLLWIFGHVGKMGWLER